MGRGELNEALKVCTCEMIWSAADNEMSVDYISSEGRHPHS